MGSSLLVVRLVRRSANFPVLFRRSARLLQGLCFFKKSSTKFYSLVLAVLKRNIVCRWIQKSQNIECRSQKSQFIFYKTNCQNFSWHPLWVEPYGQSRLDCSRLVFLHIPTERKKCIGSRLMHCFFNLVYQFDAISLFNVSGQKGPFSNFVAGTCLFAFLKVKHIWTLIWKMNSNILKGNISYNVLNETVWSVYWVYPKKIIVKISSSRDGYY